MNGSTGMLALVRTTRLVTTRFHPHRFIVTCPDAEEVCRDIRMNLPLAPGSPAAMGSGDAMPAGRLVLDSNYLSKRSQGTLARGNGAAAAATTTRLRRERSVASPRGIGGSSSASNLLAVDRA